MSPTRLYLVRHGETDWNVERRLQGGIDIPLNHRGRQQATTAALLLSTRPIDAVVSSPLSRAAETGRIIARYLELPPPDHDPLLVERSYGPSEGLTPREVADRFPTGEVPGVEPLADVVARATIALAAIADRFSGRSVAITTHSALIRAVVTHTAPDVPALRTAPIHNGSVHSLRWTASGPVLVRFDDPLDQIDPLRPAQRTP